MNTLELRKIVVVGYRFDCPDGAPLLGADGLPIDPRKHPIKIRVAFWVPAKPPFQRCAGATAVIDARTFEVQALRDGAMEEVVEEFTFPEQPSVEEMRRRLMPVWEGLTVESLGIVPNGAPQDHKPKPVIQFTAVR